jgi:CHAT domain-containing protein/Flp pilus assembly protein TadD
MLNANKNRGRFNYPFLRLVLACAVLVGAIAGCSVGQLDLKTRQAVIMSGINDPNLAGILNAAQDQYAHNDYPAALDLFNQAGHMAATPDQQRQVGLLISQYALDLYGQPRSLQALAYFESAATLHHKIDEPDSLIVDYSYLAKIRANLGRYTEAINDLGQAIALQRRTGDRAGLATNLNNLANLHSYLGEYSKAHDILEKCLATSEDLGRSDLIATTLVNLGTVKYHLRHYDQSIERLDRAVVLCERYRLSRLNATALTIRGGAYRQQGDFEKALNDYQGAIALSKTHQADEELAFAMGMVGELYKETGRLDAAAEAIEQSLEMSRNQTNLLTKGAGFYYLAEVRAKQKDYEAAMADYMKSNAVFTQIRYRDGIARNYIGIGFVALDRGNHEGAFTYFQKAVGIYNELGDREWQRVALFGKARSLEGIGKLSQAEITYKQAVEIFESIRKDVAGGDKARDLFSVVNEELYERLVALLLKMGKIEDASDYIERSRSKRLRDTLLNSGVSAADNALNDLFARYDRLSKEALAISKSIAGERSRPAPDHDKIENLKVTLTQVQSDFNAVVDAMRTDHPKAMYLLGISPKSLYERQLSGSIPSSMAILQYFITQNATYVFIATNNSLEVKTIAVGKDTLGDMVINYRRQLIPAKTDGSHVTQNLPASTDAYKALASQLYELLLRPADLHLKNTDTVAVIPFGILNILPFQALGRFNPDSGRFTYFVQEKNVIFLTSATAINMVNKPDRSKQGIERIAAFGNPDLGIDELQLSYAEVEVKTIKAIYPETSLFIGKDATKKQLKESWGNHQIIHLAAHGKFDFSKGARILLAPMRRGEVNTEFITGLQDPRLTRIVVLSACETAVFHEMKEDNVNQLPSLALSFTWVGIPSVFATLWRVEDKATSILMETFYRNLKNKMGLYESLRVAQTEMIEGGAYTSPYYWASVILFGAWL